MIGIVTDSNAQLPAELAERYGVEIVPLTVTVDGQEPLEGVDLGVAWAVGKWKGRTFPGTVAASATWVAASFLWWRKRWPNAWGPVPTGALPMCAAASSTVILYKFLSAKIRP